MSAPKVGDHIDNRYELCRQIGESDAGLLFEAAHRYTGRRVVIEFLLRWDGAADPGGRRASRAFSIGRIRHPYLVEVSDAGVADGVPYVVTALQAGRSLEGLLAARGTLSPGETATVGRQVALALDALHHHGLAHGDVSAANVWVVRSPLGDEQVELRNVQMAYGPLAPTTADPERGPSAPSDLSRLGALLFECLVGSAPPHAADAGDRPERASLFALRPDTPPGLGRVVERALSSASSERFSSARDLVVHLEATRLTGFPTRFLAGTSQQSLRAVTVPPDATPKPVTQAPSRVSSPPTPQRRSAPSPAIDQASLLARRKVPRAAYSTPARLLGHHGVMEGRIEDISTRGVLVITESPLEVGSVVQLRFATPGNGAIVQCAGVLRWVRIAPSSKRAAMGFEFQATPTELRTAVESYVAQHQGVADVDGG